MVVMFLVFGGLGAAIGGSAGGRLVTGSAFLIGLAVAFPAIVWINLAAGVKRLHDQSMSGWLMLLTYIPGIGGFFALICLGCFDGKPWRNRYGPSPKHPESEAEAFS